MNPAIWALVRKDLLRQVKDVKGLIVYLLAPLLLTMIMGLAFGGGPLFGATGISTIPLALAGGNLPEGLKEQVAAGLQESELFAVTWTDTASAGQMVARGDVQAAILLPPQLMTKFFGGEVVELQLLKDPNSPIKAGIVEMILTGTLRQFQASEAAYRALWPEDDPAQLQDLEGPFQELLSGNPRRMLRALRQDDGPLQQQVLDQLDRSLAFGEAMASPAITFEIHDRQDWEAEDGGEAAGSNLYNLFLPTFAVFFMMWGAANVVRELHREREDRTLARLLCGPISGREVTLSKWLTAIVVGSAQLLLLLLFGGLLFGVNIWHAPLAIVIVAVAAGAAAASVYLILGLLVRTEKAMDAVTTIFTLVSGMIGGNFFPVDAMGPTLLFFGRGTFNYWANRAYSDLITHNGGFGAVVPEILALLGIATIGLLVAMTLFTLRQRKGVMA